MFREMRRKRQLLERPACISILQNAVSGVLAVHGEEGYPYAVPLNYVYENGSIYFHSANSGHKIDALQKNSKVSFCVVGMDQTVPEKFTTYFQSVIVFGHAALVEDADEKRAAIIKLAEKYSPKESHEKRDAEIDREWKELTMIRINIDHMTGKQAIELVK